MGIPAEGAWPNEGYAVTDHLTVHFIRFVHWAAPWNPVNKLMCMQHANFLDHQDARAKITEVRSDSGHGYETDRKEIGTIS